MKLKLFSLKFKAFTLKIKSFPVNFSRFPFLFFLLHQLKAFSKFPATFLTLVGLQVSFRFSSAFPIRIFFIKLLNECHVWSDLHIVNTHYWHISLSINGKRKTFSDEKLLLNDAAPSIWTKAFRLVGGKTCVQKIERRDLSQFSFGFHCLPFSLSQFSETNFSKFCSTCDFVTIFQFPITKRIKNTNFHDFSSWKHLIPSNEVSTRTLNFEFEATLICGNFLTNFWQFKKDFIPKKRFYNNSKAFQTLTKTSNYQTWEMTSKASNFNFNPQFVIIN